MKALVLLADVGDRVVERAAVVAVPARVLRVRVAVAVEDGEVDRVPVSAAVRLYAWFALYAPQPTKPPLT